MGGGWGWRAARGGCSSVFFRLLALFTACPHGHLGDPQGRARREYFNFSSPALQTEAGQGLPPIAGASCGRPHPCFPQIIGKTLGFPQNAAGRVCARRVFCSAPQPDTFSPAFRLPPPWRMGIFGRAPSHPRQRGQPRGRGDGSSLAVAANIHGFSCQSPSPRRAAAPGSMKARVVRARAGASRTQALFAPSPRPQS